MDNGIEITPGQIKLLIIHEVRVVREGLARLLLTWPEFSTVDEAGLDSDGQAASSVDVILLDAGSNTSDLAHKIKQTKSRYGPAKVMVLGVVEDVGDIMAGIEAGASAYTLRDSSPQDLVDTIRRVYLGEVYCPPQISALLFERVASLKSLLIPVQDNRLTQLTRRETEILQQISDGLSNKEIAAELSLELQTVKNYVHKILEKLQVQNRRDAASYVRTTAAA